MSLVGSFAWTVSRCHGGEITDVEEGVEHEERGVVRQGIEAGADREDRVMVLRCQSLFGECALTCRGAKADKRSISLRPSVWSFVIWIPFLCVPPWTLQSWHMPAGAGQTHTRCTTYLTSLFSSLPDSVNFDSNRGTRDWSVESATV